jgi:DNA polymerase elongation subunit (family B)
MQEVKNGRIDNVLEYCNDNGETQTCEHFNIGIESLHRYQRERRWRDTANPKVLLLDIETSPIQGRFWECGKQYVNSTQIVKDWFIFGYSAKWLFSEEIMSDFVTPKEARKRDDKRIMKSAYKLISQADIIIGHCIKRFDMPKLRTRFFLNGFKPPMPYILLDTLQISRKEFAFSSNKLQYLSKLILNKEKLRTSYELWLQCEEGNKKSLKYMEEYCRMDTELLEAVYLELRPWITSHPHLPLIMNTTEQCCPNCGGFEFTEETGYYRSPQNKYEAVRCKSQA